MASGSSVYRTNVGDVFTHVESQQHCIDSLLLEGTAVSGTVKITNPVGIPVTATGVIVKAGGEATAAGLIYDVRAIEALAAGANSALPRAVAVRGAVVINESALPANDPDDAAYNWTTLKANLPSTFVYRTESPKQDTQTS